MKKFTALLAAVAIGISCVSGVFAAGTSRITISGGKGTRPIAFSYTDKDKDKEIVKSIKSLLPDIKDASKSGGVVQTLSIHSLNADAEPLDLALRLAAPETASVQASPSASPKNSPTPIPAEDKHSALDYYNIIITSDSGAVIYDYKHYDETPVSEKYKDIELPSINEKLPNESVTYKITVTVNNELKALAAAASGLDWELVINPEKKAASPSPKVSEAPDSSSAPQTSKPTVIPYNDDGDKRTDAPETPEPTPFPTMNIQPPTEAPTMRVVTPAPAGGMILTDGTYTVGNEIKAGRYEITGDSNVKVYTSGGDLKTNIILTTDEQSNDGVKDYVLTLRDGDILELSADTHFKEYTPVKTTPTPRVTSKPKATTRVVSPARATSTPRVTAKPKTTTAPKTNPGTGDNAPIVLAAIIGAAACAIFAVLEIYRRKKQ